MRICAIAGPGSFTYSNGIAIGTTGWGGGGQGVRSSGRSIGGVQVSDVSITTEKPQVMIQISGLNQRLCFQALARTGISTSLCSEPATSNDYKLIQLEVLEGTESVDLTLVIRAPRTLDFFVQPELPSGR